METGNHLEANEGWGESGVGAEDWARLQALLALVRREHLTELDPERRAQIRERVMARLERNERRRRRWRVFIAGASAVLVAGIVVTLAARSRAA